MDSTKRIGDGRNFSFLSSLERLPPDAATAPVDGQEDGRAAMRRAVVVGCLNVRLGEQQATVRLWGMVPIADTGGFVGWLLRTADVQRVEERDGPTVKVAASEVDAISEEAFG